MSKVIRGKGSRSIVSGEIFDAKQEATRIVEEARAQAAQIVAAAESERERVLDEARAQGTELARDEAKTLLATAAEARSTHLQEAEADVIALALELAERLARGPLEVDGVRLERTARELMQRVSRSQGLVVRTHPSRVEELSVLASDRVRVVGDASLTPADIIVDSELGRLDATLSAQVQALGRALTEDG